MNKRVQNFIIGIAILLIFPIVTYLALSLYLAHIGQPILDPILYVIAAITGFSTICFKATMDVWKTNLKKRYKIIFTIVFFVFGPLLIYYGLGFVTPVPITIEHFSRAMFGYVFGISVAASYEFMSSSWRKK